MKRSVKLILALFAALSMLAAACGDDDGDTDAGDDGDTTDEAMPGEGTNVGLTFDIGGRGDQSFNDSAAEGIDRAQEELGISFTEAEQLSRQIASRFTMEAQREQAKLDPGGD